LSVTREYREAFAARGLSQPIVETDEHFAGGLLAPDERGGQLHVGGPQRMRGDGRPARWHLVGGRNGVGVLDERAGA
jgi:hypothetical protein